MLRLLVRVRVCDEKVKMMLRKPVLHSGPRADQN